MTASLSFIRHSIIEEAVSSKAGEGGKKEEASGEWTVHAFQHLDRMLQGSRKFFRARTRPAMRRRVFLPV